MYIALPDLLKPDVRPWQFLSSVTLAMAAHAARSAGAALVLVLALCVCMAQAKNITLYGMSVEIGSVVIPAADLRNSTSGRVARRACVQ